MYTGVALGHHLDSEAWQGEAWPDCVERRRLVVEPDFAMFRLSFSFIVSLCHAWLFVRPRYRMTYTLVHFDLLIHRYIWYD